MAVPTDVTDPDSVASLFAKTLQRYGRVDLLFNNAGVGLSKPITEISYDEWQARRGHQPHRHVPVRPGRVPRDGRAGAARRADHQQRLALRLPAAAALDRLHGDQARRDRAHPPLALDGREFDIACGQIDVGNAETEMARAHGARRAAGGRHASSRSR